MCVSQESSRGETPQEHAQTAQEELPCDLAAKHAKLDQQDEEGASNVVVHHAMLVPQEEDASEHEEGQLEQNGKQKLQPCPQHDQHEHIEQLKRVKQLEQQV